MLRACHPANLGAVGGSSCILAQLLRSTYLATYLERSGHFALRAQGAKQSWKELGWHGRLGEWGVPRAAVPGVQCPKSRRSRANHSVDLSAGCDTKYLPWLAPSAQCQQPSQPRGLGVKLSSLKPKGPPRPGRHTEPVTLSKPVLHTYLVTSNLVTY